MTDAHKRLMRRYIKHYKGKVEIGEECDVCWAEVPERMSLQLYIDGHYGRAFSVHPPNLCLDHGRELGVAW